MMNKTEKMLKDLIIEVRGVVLNSLSRKEIKDSYITLERTITRAEKHLHAAKTSSIKARDAFKILKLWASTGQIRTANGRNPDDLQTLLNQMELLMK